MEEREGRVEREMRRRGLFSGVNNHMLLLTNEKLLGSKQASNDDYNIFDMIHVGMTMMGGKAPYTKM